MIEFQSKYDFLKYLAELNFTKGAEIGVSMGFFSEAMFKAIPNLHLYCVDNWTPYRGNRWAASERRNAIYYKTAVDRLSKYNATLIKAYSMEAVKQVKDGELDFVYIDANHSYDYVMEDLIAWGRKVRKGGIICGDDYYIFRGAGVVEATNDYVKAHGYELHLTDPYPELMDRGFHEKPDFWFWKT